MRNIGAAGKTTRHKTTNANGKVRHVALTRRGSVDPNNDPNNAAKAVYADGSATRMDRMEGVAADAASATTGSGTDAAYGEAFIDGDTAKGWTKTPHKSGNVATVEGDSGFPGLSGPYPQ